MVNAEMAAQFVSQWRGKVDERRYLQVARDGLHGALQKGFIEFAGAYAVLDYRLAEIDRSGPMLPDNHEP